MGYLGEWFTETEVESQAKVIRMAMLACMSEVADVRITRPALWNKVFYSTSIQTLWYLRTDLMAFLSVHCGEAAAREKLNLITEKFRGAMPNDQMPKPRNRQR